MLSTWTIGRVRGVPVEVHASLPLGAACVALAGAAILPTRAGQLGLEQAGIWLGPWALGLVLAAAFVLSVVLHELAHVVVAAAVRARTNRVRFTVLGGTSSFSQLRDAWSEGLVEAAGPATSVALGLLCVALFRYAPTRPADLRLITFNLAQLNLVLAVLNLVPATPLDGGRVLRALVGPRLGAERATTLSLTAGRLLAAALFCLGVVRGAPVLILIAFFVIYAALDESPPASVAAPRPALRVGDVLVPPGRPISPETGLDVLERRLREERQAAFLVVGDDGRVLGVVGLTRLAEVLPTVRAQSRVEQIMATALPHITTTMLLEAALRHMERLRVELLPVVEAGGLVGVVRRELPRPLADVARAPRAAVAVAPEPSVQPAD